MRRRRRAREGQEKRKSENRRTISKMLCAALLRSFRGQHSEKKESAQGNCDPPEGQQPFRPNQNGVGDRTTTLRRLLISADSFTFTDKVGTFNFPPPVFLCSYNVCGHFTNAPLAETIEICADALYNGELTPPPFPFELMQTATSPLNSVSII